MKLGVAYPKPIRDDRTNLSASVSFNSLRMYSLRPTSEDTMRLATLLVASLVVASTGALQLFFGLFGPSSPDVAEYLWFYAPPMLRLTWRIVAVVLEGKHGLWLLVGAPGAWCFRCGVRNSSLVC